MMMMWNRFSQAVRVLRGLTIEITVLEIFLLAMVVIASVAYNHHQWRERIRLGQILTERVEWQDIRFVKTTPNTRSCVAVARFEAR
jgi:hypothetical protein